MTAPEQKQQTHIGPSLDDYLREREALEPIRIAALKRVVAIQISEAMQQMQLTKSAMAKRMGTSRAQLDRVLDVEAGNVTIDTLAKAARAVGRELRCELV